MISYLQFNLESPACLIIEKLSMAEIETAAVTVRKILVKTRSVD